MRINLFFFSSSCCNSSISLPCGKWALYLKVCDEKVIDGNIVNHIIIDFDDYEQNEQNLKTFDPSDKTNIWKEKKTINDDESSEIRFRRNKIETDITNLRKELQKKNCCKNNSQYFVRKVLKRAIPGQFEESDLPIGGIMSFARCGGFVAKTAGKFLI